MESKLRIIYGCFEATGTFNSGALFGSGHIHETYLIQTEEDANDDYILQKINNRVFRNISQLQENLERVTSHLIKKLSAVKGSDLKRECLQLVPSKTGKSWIKDEEGNYWRMFVFIPRHFTYDIVESTEKAFEAGKAIGRFQALLSDMPGEPLFETIPSFHNVENRIDIFLNTLRNDPAKRSEGCKTEISAILRRSESMKLINKLGREGKIPIRITHNDTKFNNILFDENGKSLCIIDLDTVMPGYFHSDFGDAIRTGANIAAEDEIDHSRIKMDIELFRAYTHGYLSEAKGTLNDIEKEYLGFAPLVMTFEQAMRFLTDHLDGDRYYRIHHEGHNLQRAKAQIKLLESMEEQSVEMNRIIKECI